MIERIRSRQTEPFGDDPLSYSRLSTFIQCGWKGNQKYNLGFEPGTEASYNVQGHLCHSTIEIFHRNHNFWRIPKKDSISICHKILDGLWARQMGGKLEVAFLKKYVETLDEIYKEVKKKREDNTGYPCKAPWMTNLYKKEYKPLLADKDRIVNDIMRRMNYVEHDQLTTIFKNTYTFVENYVRLADAHFHEPEELYLEYEDDPLTSFYGNIHEKLGIYRAINAFKNRTFDLPFRGAIDQLWFSISRGGERIFIYDIKTARSQWTLDSVIHHDQLCLYAKAVYEAFGILPAKLGIIDIAHGEIIDFEPDDTTLAKFEARYLPNVATYYLMQNEKHFPPHVTKLCEHCDLGQHGACPFYQPTVVPYTPNALPKQSDIEGGEIKRVESVQYTRKANLTKRK